MLECVQKSAKPWAAHIPYSPHCESAQSRVPLKNLAASFNAIERTADVLSGEFFEDDGTAGSEKK